MGYSIENALAYAEIANEVYLEDGGAPENGWEVIFTPEDLPDEDRAQLDEKFYGALYKRSVEDSRGNIVTEFAIAYRGTDDKLEWILTNPSFLLDLIPNQFDDAYQFALAARLHIIDFYDDSFKLNQFNIINRICFVFG